MLRADLIVAWRRTAANVRANDKLPAAARRVTRLRGNLKSLRHSQFLLAVGMFWRDRRVARPCRKTYNLTLHTIQVRRRPRFSNFLTFTGPFKQREQDRGGRKASRVGRIGLERQSRLCVGYQDNRPRGRGCAPAGANQRSGRDASFGTDLPEGRSVLPFEIKPVPRDHMVPANSLIELWGVCPTSFRRLGFAASARHTASS